LTFSFSNYSSSNETINEKRSLFSMPLLKRPLQEDINSSTESLSSRYQKEKSVQINAKSIKGVHFRENQRVVLTMTAKPMHICSILPYSKKQGNSGNLTFSFGILLDFF
jgi:hypothetical protein